MSWAKISYLVNDAGLGADYVSKLGADGNAEAINRAYDAFRNLTSRGWSTQEVQDIVRDPGKLEKFQAGGWPSKADIQRLVDPPASHGTPAGQGGGDMMFPQGGPVQQTQGTGAPDPRGKAPANELTGIYNDMLGRQFTREQIDEMSASGAARNVYLDGMNPQNYEKLKAQGFDFAGSTPEQVRQAVGWMNQGLTLEQGMAQSGAGQYAPEVQQAFAKAKAAGYPWTIKEFQGSIDAKQNIKIGGVEMNPYAGTTDVTQAKPEYADGILPDYGSLEWDGGGLRGHASQIGETTKFMNQVYTALSPEYDEEARAEGYKNGVDKLVAQHADGTAPLAGSGQLEGHQLRGLIEAVQLGYTSPIAIFGLSGQQAQDYLSKVEVQRANDKAKVEKALKNAATPQDVRNILNFVQKKQAEQIEHHLDKSAEIQGEKVYQLGKQVREAQKKDISKAEWNGLEGVLTSFNDGMKAVGLGEINFDQFNTDQFKMNLKAPFNFNQDITAANAPAYAWMASAVTLLTGNEQSLNDYVQGVTGLATKIYDHTLGPYYEGIKDLATPLQEDLDGVIDEIQGAADAAIDEAGLGAGGTGGLDTEAYDVDESKFVDPNAGAQQQRLKEAIALGSMEQAPTMRGARLADPTMVDTTREAEARGLQRESIDALRSMAGLGETPAPPSMAELQLREGMDRSLNALQSALISQPGVDPSLTQRNIANNAARANRDLARDTAMMRSQEQRGAQDALTAALSNFRQQDAASAYQDAASSNQFNLQQGQMDQQTAVTNLGAAQEEKRRRDAQRAQLEQILAAKESEQFGAQMEGERLKVGSNIGRSQAEAAARGANQQFWGNLINSGAGALASLF